MKFIIVVLLSIFSLSAWSESASTSFRVTATVDAGCGVRAENVDFGVLTSAAAQTEKFTITVGCTSKVDGRLTLASTNPSDIGGTTRYLKSGSDDRIPYEIYQGNNLVGITTDISVTLTGASSTSLDFTAVRSALVEIPEAGAYSDTVNVVFDF